MEKERKGDNAHSVNTLDLVEHNILDCSYRWHLSLKVERDRFLSRFLTSHETGNRNFCFTNTWRDAKSWRLVHKGVRICLVGIPAVLGV